jgi:hypothetical protein
MFQDASAAFTPITRFVVSFAYRTIVPGRSPTRGSGLGAEVDMSAAGAGAPPAEEDDMEELHDTPASSARASGAAAHEGRGRRDDSDFTVDTGGMWKKGGMK